MERLDNTILDCLRKSGPMSPAELGYRLGMSEGEATVFLSTLIRDGKVRMPLVEVDEPTTRPDRSRSRAPARAYTRH